MSDCLGLFTMFLKYGLILFYLYSIFFTVAFVFNIIILPKVTYSYWFIIIFFSVLYSKRFLILLSTIFLIPLIYFFILKRFFMSSIAVSFCFFSLKRFFFFFFKKKFFMLFKKEFEKILPLAKIL